LKPVFLIAANFLREQRWPLIVLLGWVGFSGVIGGVGASISPDDALFFLKQQAVYGVAFSAFLAASAIHNERRSRRVLAVLSKGIERREYLAGLLCGVVFGTAVYCLGMGLAGSFVFARAGIPQQQLWLLLLLLMVAALLTATLALLFATFLAPLLATAGTALVLGAFGAMAHLAGGVWLHVLPAYLLIESIMRFSSSGIRPEWGLVTSSVIQSIVVWLIASWVFSRRDLAVAVE
jgi:hypothetical protein